MRKVGVVVSDLQVGSAFGIFPAGFRASTGSIIKLNKGQKYLLKCWDWMLEQLPKRFDFLIINGEVADGIAKKDEGRWRVEPDTTFQVEAAIELFQRGSPSLLKRAREVYVSRGSVYHSGIGGYLDEVFARRKEVGAVPDEWGHFASTWRILSVGGINIDFSHHRSACIRYESMTGEREMQFDRMVSDLKDGSADLILRAHGHRLVKLNVDGDLFLATPAWSIQTDYAKMSRWPNRWLSRLVGGARLDLYPDKKTAAIQDKEEYVKIIGLTYPHPKIGRTKHGET